MTRPAQIVVEARQARIDREGAALCDRLTFRISGERLVLAGAGASAVMAVLCARANLVAGELVLDGCDVSRGEHRGVAAVAPLDPPMPSRTTVVEYVALSFFAGGLKRREALLAARGALLDLGISVLAQRRVATLSLAERRAAALAQAMLPGASVLCAEAPLAGLEGGPAQAVLGVLGTAARQRAVIATVSRIDSSSPERDVVLGADLAAIIGRDGVAWSGTPASLMQSRRAFAVVVHGDRTAFSRRLLQDGANVAGEAARLSVTLPDGASTSLILQAARETGGVVVEMVPLWE